MTQQDFPLSGRPYLLSEFGEHRVDGAEYVKVRGRAHVTLVRGEAEDGDRQLLLLVLLRPQLGPLETPTSAPKAWGVGCRSTIRAEAKHIKTVLLRNATPTKPLADRTA